MKHDDRCECGTDVFIRIAEYEEECIGFFTEEGDFCPMDVLSTELDEAEDKVQCAGCGREYPVAR